MTDKTYHFITGLPRSGSTMLSSILLQNPKFHASISDPLATCVKGLIDTIGGDQSMQSEVPNERRKNTIHGLFNGFYGHIDKPVIFNTNRGWTYLTPLIKQVFPNSKLIVCVRDINWILDSLEIAHRKDPLTVNTFAGGPGKSVYERVESFMSEQGIVGFPYIGIKQAITGHERNRLILIEYNEICKNPEKTMRSIYNFIGEEYYEHNFNNVEKSWDEYDRGIGTKMHDVKKKIEFTPRNFILPPDILQKYVDMEVWRY